MTKNTEAKEEDFIKEDHFVSDYIKEDFTPEELAELSKKQKKAFKEIYGFAFEVNRAGREWNEADVHNLGQLHFINPDKIRKVFEKVFRENEDEFGIAHKPDIIKVEVFLRKNWDFAKNEITQANEYKLKTEDKYEVLNVDTIYRKLQHIGSKFGLDKLKSLLKSDFVDKYNPFKQYFESLPKWDKDLDKDYISEFANFVAVQDQRFYLDQFKKCLVRCIGCALYGKENRIVFVLVGEAQNTGKSTFIRSLNPFKSPEGTDKYYTEAPIHNNKDSSFAMSENFIYNLEELASLSNIDVNRLKSIISTATIKERKAYAVDAVEQPRRANFFASTNKTEFLTDTENTRWLCFNVLEVDWGYSDLDINKVWAQAFALYHDPDFSDQLSREESDTRDKKNKGYEINDFEKELIKRNFKVAAMEEGGKFFSNADIFDALAGNERKLNNRFIGKNMVQLGFQKATKTINGHTVRGYYAKQIQSEYKEPPNLFNGESDEDKLF